MDYKVARQAKMWRKTTYNFGFLHKKAKTSYLPINIYDTKYIYIYGLTKLVHHTMFSVLGS